MRKCFNDTIIRLKRRGCKNYAVYDIVVCLRTKRRDGAFLEKLGYLNPQFTENKFVIDTLRLGYWTRSGAMVHPTVKKYFVKFLVN